MRRAAPVNKAETASARCPVHMGRRGLFSGLSGLEREPYGQLEAAAETKLSFSGSKCSVFVCGVFGFLVGMQWIRQHTNIENGDQRFLAVSTFEDLERSKIFPLIMAAGKVGN